MAKGVAYHSSCLSSYLSETNIQANKKSKDQISSVYQQAFDQLITEIHKDLTENGKAFYMSSLSERFNALLPDDISSENYRSSKLQRRLQNHYKDEIIIQSQRGRGKSNIIISSKITAGDAVRTAQQLTKVVPNSNTLENDNAIFTDDNSDHDRVLYHAASILRDELFDLKSYDRYPAPNKIGIVCLWVVTTKAFKMILWLIDSDAYASKESDYNPTDDMNRKSTSIVECILLTSKNVLTTQHIGLAMQLPEMKVGI